MRIFAQRAKPIMRTSPVKSSKHIQSFVDQDDARSVLRLQQEVGNQAARHLLHTATENFDASFASNCSNDVAQKFSCTLFYQAPTIRSKQN